ncbi:alcohol dehydrogenase yqhd [Anaeramoeba flamelloides]|nr:alcohol dehydrogenase yqhd [Anaeramoeba flamelloides]
MNNFTFYNPTKIIFGRNTITSSLKQNVPKNSRILLTYGKGSIFKNGVYNQAIKGLEGNGHKIFEYGGITPNPRYKHGMEAVELIKKNDINFLLALGGGSVLDLTKFMSVASCWTKGGDPWIMYQKRTIPKYSPTGALPIADVMTIPAAGSEANCGSVVTREYPTQNRKIGLAHPLMFPKFSVLDPEITFTLPWRQTRNGIVDSFVHIIEQYVNSLSNNPIIDGFSETLLKTLIDSSYVLLKKPKDYGARANIFWASSCALNGIIRTGIYETDFVMHHLGHEITALTEADHGLTLAVLLPAVWKNQFEIKKEKLARYAENVWGIKYGSIEEKAKKAIDFTVNWLHDIKMPTNLSACGKVDPKLFPKMADQAIKYWAPVKGSKGLGQFGNLGVKECVEIYKTCEK